MVNEKCIMPKSYFYRTERFEGSHKHHIFGGANRQLSDEDGLVVFLTPEMHNMSKRGVHFNKHFAEYLKRVGQKTWMEYYGKTKEDFIKRYGRSWI